MIKIDKDGLLLCEIQGKTFEISVENYATGSEVFMRRFMNSQVAKEFDNLSVLDTNIYEKDILIRLDEEYGVSNYGKVRYTKNEMFWIGYIYRYFSYTYKKTSKQVYKIIKPKELRGLFLPYHTMDPAQAIERILEAKGLPVNGEMSIEQQYMVFKRIRLERQLT
ncbi:MAG: antitoxin [Lachnospiraceae bacterium]|nr:antitoxin [Lachnospiraceae bacterium]